MKCNLSLRGKLANRQKRRAELMYITHGQKIGLQKRMKNVVLLIAWMMKLRSSTWE